jgi:hypothetical protein
MTLRRRWCTGTIISSDGWAVKFVSRSMIAYWDKVSRVYVSAEAMADGKSWSLYPSDMRVGRERGKALMDDSRRATVVERIKAACEFSGYGLKVV